MRNSSYTVKNKTISSYTTNNEAGNKSTNINVLLNRVRVDQKREKRKKILFFSSSSLGLLLFGIIIF